MAHDVVIIEMYALAVSGSDLYVGGQLTQSADGTVTNLGNIARYSGGAWSALANNGLNGWVNALAVIGSDLYVGGEFTQTADLAVTNLNYIAKYSGGTWSALPNYGLNGGVYDKVEALAVSGSDLYVSGYFHQTADGTVTNLRNIAKYSGGAWSALAHDGLNCDVMALAVSGSDLYVGGCFDQTAEGPETNNLNNIAKWGASTTPSPQLALAKTVSPASAKPGEAITYTIAFSNTGTVIATNVRITDTLSANLTHAGNTSSGVALTQVPGSRYAWTAPDLAQNQGGVVTITGVLTKPLAAGTLPNVVTLAVSGTVKTANADLTMQNVAPVANAGPDQSKNFSSIVTLDGRGSTDDNGDALTYGWTQTGGTAVTFAPDLSVTTFTAPATSAVLTFTLMVTDTGGLTGTDTVVVTVANLADLSVTENVVRVSNTITYTVVAQNLGPNAASGAVVSSTFPAEVANVTWTCAGSGGAVCGGSGSGNSLADTLTTFPAGGVVTYTVRGTLDLLAAGNNMVTITPPSGVVDPNLANNQATYNKIYRCFLPLILKNASPQ